MLRVEPCSGLEKEQTAKKLRTIPCYLYRTCLDDSIYLFETDIDESIPVPALRKQLAGQLADLAGLKTVSDSRIRIREIGHSIMRDDQTALNAVRWPVQIFVFVLT